MLGKNDPYSTEYIKSRPDWRIDSHRGRVQPYTVWGRTMFDTWQTWMFTSSLESAQKFIARQAAALPVKTKFKDKS